MLKVTEIRGCCGANIVYDFGWTSVTYGIRYRKNKLKIKEELKNIIQNHSLHRFAFVQIILNTNQNKHLKDILLNCGFFLVSKRKNRLHNSNLFLYLLGDKNNEN